MNGVLTGGRHADGCPNDVHDPLLLLGGDTGPERYREVLVRGALGLRQRALLVAEVSQRGLEVQRRQVVLGVPDLRLRKRGADSVALGRAADEEVVHVAGLVDRDLAELAQAQLGVARGRLAARRRPAVQLAQEDPQRRRLDLVEPRVVADVLERLLRLRAVEAEHPDALRELGVPDGDEAAVAEAEEASSG